MKAQLRIHLPAISHGVQFDDRTGDTRYGAFAIHDDCMATERAVRANVNQAKELPVVGGQSFGNRLKLRFARIGPEKIHRASIPIKIHILPIHMELRARRGYSCLNEIERQDWRIVCADINLVPSKRPHDTCPGFHWY